jgi:hypothetical protein
MTEIEVEVTAEKEAAVKSEEVKPNSEEGSNGGEKPNEELTDDEKKKSEDAAAAAKGDEGAAGPGAAEEGKVDETVDEDAEAIAEWRKSTGKPAAEPKLDETSQKELLGLREEVVTLRAEVEKYKKITESPLMKAYQAHVELNGNENPKEFLKHVGAINEISALTPDQKLDLYFRKKAKSLGVAEEKMQDVVEREIAKLENFSELDVLELVKKAEAELTEGTTTSIEQLTQEYEQKASKIKSEMIEWSKKNFDEVQSLMDTFAKKGRFQDRDIEPTKWKAKILKFLGDSQILLDPSTGFYDTNGDIDAPEVIKFLDWNVNREEIQAHYKKLVNKSLNKNLEEKSAEAHKIAISNELATNPDVDKEILAAKNALRAANGLPLLTK